MITELKCDYDGPLPLDMDVRTALVVRKHQFHVEWVSLRRTKRGWHYVIAVRGRVAFHRVVLLQALLGSDWKRELFNSRRAIAWRNVPDFWRSRANVLYTRHFREVTL